MKTLRSRHTAFSLPSADKVEPACRPRAVPGGGGPSPPRPSRRPWPPPAPPPAPAPRSAGREGEGGGAAGVVAAPAGAVGGVAAAGLVASGLASLVSTTSLALPAATSKRIRLPSFVYSKALPFSFQVTASVPSFTDPALSLATCSC